MQKRNPLAVFGLGLITFGIYSIYWYVKTKGELNSQGAQIPTAWLLIVPIANWWWLWKYSQGVDSVTKQKMSQILAFVLLFVLGAIGQAIIQDTYNGLDAETTSPSVSPGPTTPNSAVPTATPNPSVSPTVTPTASTGPTTTTSPTPAPDTPPAPPTVTPPSSTPPNGNTPKVI